MSGDVYSHLPVLLNETIDALDIKSNGQYVDGTYGRGGHANAILHCLGEQGGLMVIDKDLEAIAVAKNRLIADKRVHIHHGSFADLKQFVQEEKLMGQINGVLLDLGVSSPQLENPNRGFSFRRDGPLDMRMDITEKQDAADWVNSVSEDEIIRVIKEYGEERFAKRIARAIVEERVVKPITTTAHLANIVASAKPIHEKNKHPATRVFQAIRIVINRELEELSIVLGQLLDVLAIGGRLVIISFHSLEDRLVKRFITKHVKGDVYPAKLPIPNDALCQRLKKIGKPIKALDMEVTENPRARSAILRVAEKIA